MVGVYLALKAASLSNNFTQGEMNHPLAVQSPGSWLGFCYELSIFPRTNHITHLCLS